LLVSDRSFWARLKEAHIWRVLLVYLAASWVILQLAATLNELFSLPSWLGPVTLALLAIGLLVMLATAWVQSHPLTDRREVADEVPDSWEIDVKEFGEALLKGRLPHLTWARAVLGGVFAFSLLFGFAGLYVVIQDRGRSFVPEEAIAGEADPGIAFMPFTVSGSGLEHLREGMVTLLFASLDGAAGLRAISDRTVLAQWDRLVGTGQRADLETAMSVAGATGARYTLLGSVVSVGPRLQLSGDIYELPDGTPLGRVQVEGSADSLQALVGDLAVETLRALAQAGVETVPRADLGGVTTHSLPALTAYLEGEAYFRRGDFDGAIPHFLAALELDSTFALAHYRMVYAGWAGAGGEEHQQKALEGNLTPRRRLLARGANHEPGLREDLEDLVRRYPDDAEAWFVLGDWYTHVLPLGVDDFVERAKGAFTRAAELDAGFAPYVIHLIDFAFNEDDAAEAARWIAAYGRASPGSASDRSYRIAYRLLFEPPEGSSAFEASIDTLARTQLARPGLVTRLLNHPRVSRIGIAFLLRRAELTDELSGEICWKFALAQGRWSDFLAYSDDPRLAPGWRFACLVQAHWRDYPVAEELLEEALPREAPELELPGTWEVIAYAASKGRWEEYERRLAALRATPKQAADAPIIEGYRLLRAGDLEQARKTLEGAPQLPPVRWWLGQISLEIGQPAAAAWYFSTFFDSPLGNPWTRSLYYLGLAYEQMGELEKAQEAYAEYLDIWKEADPELEPLKEQARARLEAILAARG
jgi:tetratricopeptide (TPR) repeat protein